MTSGEGRGVRGAAITVSGGSLVQPITVPAGPRGNYVVEGLMAGETYVISVSARRFTFVQPIRVITLNDNAAGVDFNAEP